MKNSELIKDYILKYYNSEIISENNGVCLFTIKINNHYGNLHKFITVLQKLCSISGIAQDTIYSEDSAVYFSMTNEDSFLIWKERDLDPFIPKFGDANENN